MNIRTILVPVDYSQCSRAALQFAAELASKIQASLDIVHAWDRPSYITDAVLATSEPVSGHSLLRMIQENAQNDMDEFLKATELPSATIVSGRLITGEPVSALLRELEKGKHGLVVVGTHGRSGLTRVLLGSVAEKLVRLSPVPVITVPDEHARARRT